MWRSSWPFPVAGRLYRVGRLPYDDGASQVRAELPWTGGLREGPSRVGAPAGLAALGESAGQPTLEVPEILSLPIG